MSFTLKTLTEGIRDRHVGQQNKRLVEKWSRTGLLRGMDDVNREVMATLLENQAAQVLRESNSMGSGDVGGFTNIAFPIVRRVFGGLIANELVSIQPMSLPSGLLFYLDYTYGNANGAYGEGESIYGGPAGKAIQSGALAQGGQYDLVGSGFSRVHSLAKVGTVTQTFPVGDRDVKGDLIDTELMCLTADKGAPNADVPAALVDDGVLKTDKSQDLKMMQFDSQIIDRIDNNGEFYTLLLVHPSICGLAGVDSFVEQLDQTQLKNVLVVGEADTDGSNIANGGAADILSAVHKDVQVGGHDGTTAIADGSAVFNVRRLTQLGTWDGTTFTSQPEVSLADETARIQFVVRKTSAAADMTNLKGFDLKYVIEDTVSFAGGEASGSPSFESNLPADGTAHTPTIPEIDIKIESIPVTAQTRKLRARWSPELAQDLNAYHSMDAEVELTQILSEQIALEIDREILGDLLTGAKGANFYWSRSPGKFVNKKTGAEVARTSTLNPGPAFTGTVREWYETLTETVIDVANEIHRKTLRGSANFIVVSPDVATILEASVLYRPSYSLDGDGQVGAPFTMGAEKMGSLSNRFTVYKDPYFPRNKILVGYKGGSYLETGFVYAPYVPLIVTPTIFQPDDFTPRKGVMTRYGKKMVRADFYGTVTCLDMNII
jgi:hypothetical protein